MLNRTRIPAINIAFLEEQKQTVTVIPVRHPPIENRSSAVPKIAPPNSAFWSENGNCSGRKKNDKANVLKIE